jgi:hypothetical protein
LAGPGRSLLGAVNGERRRKGRSPARSTLQAWAASARRWRWRERAEAWDECQRQEARRVHADRLEEMNRRHAQEAFELQGKAVQRLQSLDPERLSTADVLRFCLGAAKLERAVLGAAPHATDAAPAAGGVSFTLEDAVRADRELEEFHHDQLHARPSPRLERHGTSLWAYHSTAARRSCPRQQRPRHRCNGARDQRGHPGSWLLQVPRVSTLRIVVWRSCHEKGWFV